jgi:phosphate transport system substrate-binding protein
VRPLPLLLAAAVALALLVSGLLADVCLAADISGAGSAFAAPLYTRWAADYEKARGRKVSDQAVGSSNRLERVANNATRTSVSAAGRPLA